jgi:hypothetical protein
MTEHQQHDDKHPVRIDINKKNYVAPDEEMTGAKIKELAGIPPANLLLLESRHGGDDQQIADNQVVELHPDDCFYDMPPANFG